MGTLKNILRFLCFFFLHSGIRLSFGNKSLFPFFILRMIIPDR